MMNPVRLRPRSSFMCLLIVLLATVPLVSATLPNTKPEEVGLSSERLQRISQLIQRRIDAGEISGAITAVARNGRIAHFEAKGLMDIETRKPMAKDAIFRIASMSKPITGVAIMMLVEEGKVRLTDPVSRFIPEFKDLEVAVPRSSNAPPAAAGARGAAPSFYTVPADREITIRDLLTHTSGLVSGTISTAEAAKVARKQGETLAATGEVNWHQFWNEPRAAGCHVHRVRSNLRADAAGRERRGSGRPILPVGQRQPPLRHRSARIARHSSGHRHHQPGLEPT